MVDQQDQSSSFNIVSMSSNVSMLEEEEEEEREVKFYDDSKVSDDYLVDREILAKVEGQKIYQMEETDKNKVYLIHNAPEAP